MHSNYVDFASFFLLLGMYGVMDMIKPLVFYFSENYLTIKPYLVRV